MASELKLTEEQKRIVKGLIDKETIETFITRAEKHIEQNNLKGAMTYLVALVAKYLDDERVLSLKNKYENTYQYKRSKKIYESSFE